MNSTIHLACIVGARPNFMKMAPLLRAIDARDELKASLIHTGQHYDAALSDVFFEQLEMRRPDVSLGIGSGTQAGQTARILEGIEPVLQHGLTGERPFDRLVVVGDVNSTMAAAIAAAKLGIAISHVEAGLRSFDRTMPEEINRLITDAISDQLLVSEPSGVENLRREGHADSSIHLVGNLMIDTLKHLLPQAQSTSVLEEHGLKPGHYGVVTLHRPSNVDDPDVLAGLLEVLADLSQELPLAFPLHPRTAARITQFGLDSSLSKAPGILKLPPLGYLEFLALTSSAKMIVTDSGGLQEESTALGVPCLTMRENTERPCTVTHGSSTLIGNDLHALQHQFREILEGRYDVGHCPELWDGHAAGRIADLLATR